MIVQSRHGFERVDGFVNFLSEGHRVELRVEPFASKHCQAANQGGDLVEYLGLVRSVEFCLLAYPTRRNKAFTFSM
jgi:hypothetical protein